MVAVVLCEYAKCREKQLCVGGQVESEMRVSGVDARRLGLPAAADDDEDGDGDDDDDDEGVGGMTMKCVDGCGRWQGVERAAAGVVSAHCAMIAAMKDKPTVHSAAQRCGHARPV